MQNISPDIVAAQIDAVFDDIRPSAVKIGMVSSAEIIEVIADRLSAWDAQNIVVDPVMVATSGARLIAEDAAEALTRRLFPLATVITPNIPEAMALLDYEVDSERTQQNAAMLLTRRFGCASLVKGGHFVNEANDVLAEPAPLDDEGNHLGDPLTTWFRHKRIDTNNTHGTGCTLSSAIACALAQGMDLADAVNAGKAYLTGALAAGLTWAEVPAPSITCGNIKIRSPKPPQRGQAPLRWFPQTSRSVTVRVHFSAHLLQIETFKFR